MGQNFLADPNMAAAIVRHARLEPDDVVLEIGAGLGALTLPLATQVEHVFAVESDGRIAAILKDELLASGVDNVTVIEEDILRFDIRTLAKRARGTLTVMGNLPYHISSQVLVQLIDARMVVGAAFLMFQKELAERLTAKPGTKTYGRLSVLVQYCANTAPLVSVHANAFFPRPKVDSQVVGITFQDPVDFPVTDEGLLFGVVKAAFGKRRKMLKNALTGSDLGFGGEIVSGTLARAGIDEKRRAETLSVEEFVNLANAFHGHSARGG
jgi:16S rRNA (adenine1518-N6/adenine1519-N6)-dimethyltransferase